MNSADRIFALFFIGAGILISIIGILAFIQVHDQHVEDEFDYKEDVKELNCDELIIQKQIVDKKIGEGWKKQILITEAVKKECKI